MAAAGQSLEEGGWVRTDRDRVREAVQDVVDFEEEGDDPGEPAVELELATAEPCEEPADCDESADDAAAYESRSRRARLHPRPNAAHAHTRTRL